MKRKLLAGLMSATLALGSLMFTPSAAAEIREYVGTGEYIMSDYETPVVAKERAKARAMANAQEQAGVYVERHLQVSNYMVDSDVINLITKGIVNLVGTPQYKQTPIEEDGGSYQIVATVRVNIDSDNIDGWFSKSAQDRDMLVEQNRELQRSNVEKDRQIEELRRLIADVKSESEQENLTSKFETADKEFLSNQKIEEGTSYLYAAKNKDAFRAFSEAIELNPRNAQAYYLRGRTYTIGDTTEAIADFTKAIELKPDYESAALTIR